MKMRSKTILCASAFALAACAACGPSQPTANVSNSSAQSNASQRPAQTVEVPPVASAHGGATNSPAGAPATAPASGAASADKPTIATPELDAKIAKAESKAKAPGASEADKKAAAAAYVERANVYYTAQQPVLYKFALGDFRRALKYDPSNSVARERMDQIVSIYQSMGRPVPSNGLDQ
jgi:hypothetical protein